jgi:hypothetical protein
LLPGLGNQASTTADVQEGARTAAMAGRTGNRDRLGLPMVGKDSHRTSSGDDRFASSSGLRHWTSETISSVWRDATNHVGNGKGHVLMDLHRDALASLSPLDPRFATVVEDEPAKRLGTSGGRDFDDIVDGWGSPVVPSQ